MGHSHLIGDLPVDVIIGDGSRSFTGRVQGVDPINAQDFATRAWVLTNASSSASKIQGRDVAADTPADGDALIWDTSRLEYVPKQQASAGILGRYPMRWADFYVAGANTMALTVSGSGSPRFLTGDNTPGVGSTYQTDRQAETLLPVGYPQTAALSVRVRAKLQSSADTSNEIDVEVYRTAGKMNVDLTADLVTTLKQALSTDWADYDFDLDLSLADIGEGDSLLVVVKYITDDSGGSGFGLVTIGRMWLTVGSIGESVGTDSLVGSAEVG